MIPAPPESGPPPVMPEPPAVPTVTLEPLKKVRTEKVQKRANPKTVAAEVPALVAVTPAPAVAAEPAAVPATTAPTVEPKPVEPPVPPKPLLKDGTYSGWGTSRHGDIQATVVIENGRIASAYIAQCLTRYSCSWIAGIVPQVVQRQSAEVDYVSGATQSTNAFYYAVLEALSKAK